MAAGASRCKHHGPPLLVRRLGLGLLLAATIHCGASERLPLKTVAQQGTADFHTIQEAIDAAPATGEIIRLAPGTYREKIHINTPNIHLIGTGKQPQDVVLSWDDAANYLISEKLSLDDALAYANHSIELEDRLQRTTKVYRLLAFG